MQFGECIGIIKLKYCLPIQNLRNLVSHGGGVYNSLIMGGGTSLVIEGGHLVSYGGGGTPR